MSLKKIFMPGCASMKSEFLCVTTVTFKLIFHCRYYYQYQEDRLCVCTTVINGLLHIAANIQYCAPIWATWTYHVEQMCGNFQGNLGSKRDPASSIDKRVLQGAYLDQLGSRFDLSHELDEVGKRPKGTLSQGETIKADCKCTLTHAILCNPILLRTPLQTKITFCEHLIGRCIDPMTIFAA
jgi:hypothetical protein